MEWLQCQEEQIVPHCLLILSIGLQLLSTIRKVLESHNPILLHQSTSHILCFSTRIKEISLCRRSPPPHSPSPTIRTNEIRLQHVILQRETRIDLFQEDKHSHMHPHEPNLLLQTHPTIRESP